MSNNVVYLTEEGLQKIKEELEYLKNVKRPEIARKLQEAIRQGDLSENADYDYAKQEQGMMEARIRDLEDAQRRAQVIKDDGPTDRVRVGSTVTVVEDGVDERETYRIVGAHEANPSNGYISNESPFGRALLGARLNQQVTVSTPAGDELYLRVVAIE
ncbi:MAG: transcription elongation factor GreA [Ardenticatenaceae bacterium]|nr:transcription elongation factor GreA [Anaerolineales bacterium]MCB8917632.1 transcription elongation factor GreA [Ardenticatenaceae bacterium]